MGSVLPPEIFAYICGQIDPSHLVPVCRVSRLLRDQAQRILYLRPDLRGQKIKSVRSWCLAVTQHSHLAERVHSLSLQPPDDLDPADAGRISVALRKCVNLKSLAVLRVEHPWPYTPGSLHTWMLEDCPFRLTTFTNSYFSCGRLEKIWDTQREIRVLSFPKTVPPHAFIRSPGTKFPADTQLPNLIALEVLCDSDLTDIYRPLQRIQIRIIDSLPDLSRFSRTLTTLSLGRSASLSFKDIFLCIARMLPTLLHLGIFKHKAASPGTSPLFGVTHRVCIIHSGCEPFGEDCHRSPWSVHPHRDPCSPNAQYSQLYIESASLFRPRNP
ncbi:hypothetical protein C8J57DRAFT_1315044 [Mycena rebaudengoi]|nr:hypothetical protein C8J57DRAFT_1315044 [Mycena rebaudengoi]